MNVVDADIHQRRPRTIEYYDDVTREYKAYEIYSILEIKYIFKKNIYYVIGYWFTWDTTKEMAKLLQSEGVKVHSK